MEGNPDTQRSEILKKLSNKLTLGAGTVADTKNRSPSRINQEGGVGVGLVSLVITESR